MSSMDYWKLLPDFIKSPNPEIYVDGRYLVLDFETTTLDYGNPNNPNNKILCASWEIWDSNWLREKKKTVWRDEYNLGELLKDIEKVDFIVVFNGGFELGWLKRCGADITNILLFDCQVAEWVIAGNRSWGLRASLEASSRRWGLGGKESFISKLIRSGVSTEDISPKWLMRYCARDVELTGKLFRHQSIHMSRKGLLNVAYCRNLFIPAKTSMESYGMKLDKDRVTLVDNFLQKERKALLRKFNLIAEGVNFKSVPQREEFIYDVMKFGVPKGAVTKKGTRKTDKNTLNRLKPKNKKQREFVNTLKALTANEAKLSKFIAQCKKCVDETEDGILYASINQCTTQTHRVSSTGRKYGVQLQNTDRELKPVFRARYPGWDIAEIDEAGLEFRAAAELAKCSTALEFIEHGNDPHEFSGRIIFEDSWNTEESAKSENNAPYRQQAKAHTFKPLYGGRSGTPNERKYYEAFREKFSGITAIQEKWKKEVLATKKLRTVSGLMYYWPDTRITDDGYVTNSTNICNYPVQGFATADIVPMAVAIQWYLIQALKMKSFLVNTVHDSSIGEVSPDERELFEEIAVLSFTKFVQKFIENLYDFQFALELEAEYESYQYWKDSPDWENKWTEEIVL